jgi:hypothetical protein
MHSISISKRIILVFLLKIILILFGGLDWLD